jgi:hypothetical protein
VGRIMQAVPHEEVINKEGITRIPSVFMFESIMILQAFLHVCDKQKSTVIFENENITINPGDDTTMRLLAYSVLLENREIGNNYIKYLTKTNEMSWDKIRRNHYEKAEDV